MGRLGEGGMGVVYLGRTSGGAPVAIKTIRREHADDPDFRERFRRELDATLRVSGRYVAAVIDADVEGAPPFFVTEYIAGDTLEAHIVRRGPIAGEQLAAFAAGVATGLAELHARDVAHRDLTPRNVVLSLDGPKLIDLGIAHVRGATRLTQTGVSIGTPAWMAPEHARGETVGAPADVFAWAGLVVFAATGAPPFGEGRAESVLYRIVHEDPRLDELDEPLRSLVEGALRKEPLARPEARELAASLTGSSGDLTATATAAATMLQRTRLADTAPGSPSDKAGELTATEATAVEDKRLRPRGPVLAAAAVLGLAGALAAAAWLGDPGIPGDGPEGTAADFEETEGNDETDEEVSEDDELEPGDEDADFEVGEGVEPEEAGDTDPPRPTDPDPPWAGPAQAPQAEGERHAAEWWDEWMPDHCGLYLPLELEETNNLTLEGPIQTRVGDVQFVWHDEAGEWSGLTLHVWDTEDQNVRRYFENEPAMTFSDGSELYTVDNGNVLDGLYAIAGEDCFYEVAASSMVARDWGMALRQVELP